VPSAPCVGHSFLVPLAAADAGAPEIFLGCGSTVVVLSCHHFERFSRGRLGFGRDLSPPPEFRPPSGQNCSRPRRTRCRKADVPTLRSGSGTPAVEHPRKTPRPPSIRRPHSQRRFSSQKGLLALPAAFCRAGSQQALKPFNPTGVEDRGSFRPPEPACF